MKKTVKIIVALLMLAMLPVALEAQTRQETNNYKKFLKKPTITAADKFLKKYPESVYAPKVVHLKDSLELLRITSVTSKERALELAGDCLDAMGWRYDDVEKVLALDDKLNLRILSPAGEVKEYRTIPRYTLEDDPDSLTLVLPMEAASPLGKRNYVHFAYKNGAAEYVEVLYLPEEDIVNQVLFYGGPLPGGKIEGQSPESIEGLNPTAEVAWLLMRLQENKDLVPIAKADWLTDSAIRWWLENNPGAQSSAGRLHFGALDPESSIVEGYRKARKEKGKNCAAALFDIRGYTVICSGAGGKYTLLWCEPVCKNTRRDKYLNNIYFENDGTTLDLFYYKGGTTFKYKISTASQTIRR